MNLTRITNYFVILIFCIIPNMVMAGGNIDINEINRLLGKSPGLIGVKITSIDKIFKINEGKDLLMTVDFAVNVGGGGCCLGVLYDKKLKEASLIKGYVFDVKILDLDNDGISEIEKTNSNYGQGYERNEKEILQYKNGQQHSLHLAIDGNNGGIYDEADPEYEKSVVNFVYKDINGDGVKDLIEKWEYHKKNKITHTEKFFFFKNDKFIEDKKMLSRPPSAREGLDEK